MGLGQISDSKGRIMDVGDGGRHRGPGRHQAGIACEIRGRMGRGVDRYMVSFSLYFVRKFVWWTIILGLVLLVNRMQC